MASGVNGIATEVNLTFKKVTQVTDHAWAWQ
jgi:hypothetical protein